MDNKIEIDGDKVIAFINAVQSLGDILKQLNVIEIKEAFLVGNKIKSVEQVIRLSDEWKLAIEQVLMGTENHAKIVSNCVREERMMIALLKSVQGTVQSKESKDALNHLKEFASTLDCIQKHKDSGLLEALLK